MAPTASPPSPPPPARRPRQGPPAGLKNLGNTCYLNSVLQCLASTSPLASFCLSSRHSILCKKVFPNKDKECAFCLIERQIGRLVRAESGTLESPGKLIRCMPLFAEHFRWGRQEDAHEFLRYVVDACHTAGLRIRKHHPTNANGECGLEEGWGQGTCMVMKETFGGALLSQVKCLMCKGESNKTDDIMDISLDLHGSSSVGEALAHFFQPEILEGANKYSCERCKKLTRARKQMFIHRAPKVLVIQLKRFEGINGGKINKNIEFKEVIVLSDFMYNKNQGQPVYNLFGSIVHSGLSPESGHYYAYVKDATDRWYCCNDSHVSSSSSQEVLSEKVYILFYILSSKNQKPSTNGYSYSAVKSSNTNGNGIPNVTSSEPLKIPLVKHNGSYFTRAMAPLPSKNGKIAPGPGLHIKPIHLKNTGIEKVTSNGKATIISQTKPEVNGVVALPELDGCEPRKSAEPSKRNVNSNISRDTLEANSQRILPGSNGNGHLIPVNGLQKSYNATATCAEQYSEHSSSTTASLDKKSNNSGNIKSSVLQQEVPANSVNDVVAPVKDSAGLKRPLEEAKFKEMLAESASSGLQSSGWVDLVSNFMRSEKRRCVKKGGMPQDIDAWRKQLIMDSRKFRSAIPDPLMGHLIQSLKSYFSDKF